MPAGEAVAVTRSLPHGHVAAVLAQAKALGLPALLGPAGRQRDLALALILVPGGAPGLEAGHRRLVGRHHPRASTWRSPGRPPTRSTRRWTGCWAGRTASKNSWPARISTRRSNPSRMAMFDLSSSWVTGRHCDLAARGYSRDGKKGCEQIEYGLLTDPAGRPVAVRVFPGNTADPAAFTHAVDRGARTPSGWQNMVMVGDRGMITSARIDRPQGTRRTRAG